MHKKVFIIIISYNGEKWLQKNLESLQQSNYPIQVLVVDNHSTDNSVAIIESFTNIQLIKSDANLGFGKANNLGIKEALKQEADYVFLLNQDTWVFPDTIGSLVLVAESNKKYGILSPLHFSNDATVLDENFNTYWNRKTNEISENIDEVPFVNAAAWLIPKHVVEQIGYFEWMFQHYGEDRNYVNRVVFHDYKVVIVKASKICHDRTIVRNFKKDMLQSKFQILNAILNVNHSLFKSYWNGFISVFGLPKYFFKYYSLLQSLELFFSLLGYFIGLKIKVFSILKTRSSYK
ncbi:glycosyl transferase [Pseudalgibacter alginicilyticus]|uniref:Glycosyl transferase n=1 Tax=Pseudalgibacter alginicilyticus TaxID=1736674 RepID=A0A0N7HYB9_9FLAO|nr:glycosyl transferase [Pseudalgibacter alginicilyticus]